MLKKTVRTMLTFAVLTLPLSTLASSPSPLGTWKTIDDKTGKAKSFVTIQEDNGKLNGTITRIFDETKRNAICEKCDGDLKNKKIEGMRIIWNMEKDGDKYDDGKIVDPESGKIYSANMKVLEEGSKLEVRGYIGFSLMGRSQIWERVQ